ncbi:MAG: protein LphB [Tatlockia sp.]|jgi:hypothetical protein
MNRKKWFIIGLTGLFTYLLLLQVIASWYFTIDDMYISMRYAKHWVLGHGLVWNIGEEPVEGYSNFSFVTLAALAMQLTLQPLFFLKATGVVSLLFSTLAIYLLSRFFVSKVLAVIPCLWMLLYRGEILWSVSGLETITYQALIGFALYFLLRGMGYCSLQERKEAHSGFGALAGFFMALAGVTRPEAPALMLLFMSLALWDKPKNSHKTWYRMSPLYAQFLVFTVLGFVVPYLPYFLWRLHYFGRLFPNPVYCKSFGFFAVLDRHYLKLALPFFLLSIPAILKEKTRLPYFFWLPSLLYLVLLLDADFVSAFENRLFLPVFVLLLPTACWGLSLLCQGCLKNSDEEVQGFSVLVCAFLVLFFCVPMFSLGAFRYFSINPQAGINLRESVLSWINEHVKPDSKIVLADCGQIPYFSALHYIDSYCLNNKSMTVPYSGKMYQRLCERILVEKPEVLILTSLRQEQRVEYTPTDACLHEKLKQSALYKKRKIYSKGSKHSAYRYEIYTLVD